MIAATMIAATMIAATLIAAMCEPWAKWNSDRESQVRARGAIDTAA